MLKPRTLIGLGIVTVLILALCTTLAVFTYGITRRQWDGPATRTFARMTSFPVGKVGKRSALYVDYLAQLDAQKIYLQTPDARTLNLPTAVNHDTRTAAYSQIMQIAALQQLGDELGASTSPTDIDNAFNDFVAQSGTSTTPGEIDTFLNKSFGWTRNDFKKFFIQPAALSQALRAKMDGATQDDKSKALTKKIEDRLNQTDVKRYMIIAQ